MKLLQDLLMTDYGLMSFIVVVAIIIAMIAFAIVVYRRAFKNGG